MNGSLSFDKYPLLFNSFHGIQLQTLSSNSLHIYNQHHFLINLIIIIIINNRRILSAEIYNIVILSDTITNMNPSNKRVDLYKQPK